MNQKHPQKSSNFSQVSGLQPTLSEAEFLPSHFSRFCLLEPFTWFLQSKLEHCY